MTQKQVLERAQQIWGPANVLYVEPPTGGNCWTVHLRDDWSELLTRLLPGEDKETFKTTRHLLCEEDGYAACHSFCGEVLDQLAVLPHEGLHRHGVKRVRIH